MANLFRANWYGHDRTLEQSPEVPDVTAARQKFHNDVFAQLDEQFGEAWRNNAVVNKHLTAAVEAMSVSQEF